MLHNYPFVKRALFILTYYFTILFFANYPFTLEPFCYFQKKVTQSNNYPETRFRRRKQEDENLEQFTTSCDSKTYKNMLRFENPVWRCDLDREFASWSFNLENP